MNEIAPATVPASQLAATARRRRLDADQPPDDLPRGADRLSRLPLGLDRRRDRLLERRRDRDPDRSRRHRRHSEPVHEDRDRLLRARAGDRRPHRRGRLQRLPPGRPGRRDLGARSAARPRSSTRASSRGRRSSQGIRDDHTYVKPYGNDGPDIRVTARSPGAPNATLGDTISGPRAGPRGPGAARRPRGGAAGHATSSSCCATGPRSTGWRSPATTSRTTSRPPRPAATRSRCSARPRPPTASRSTRARSGSSSARTSRSAS